MRGAAMPSLRRRIGGLAATAGTSTRRTGNTHTTHGNTRSGFPGMCIVANARLGGRPRWISPRVRAFSPTRTPHMAGARTARLFLRDGEWHVRHPHKRALPRHARPLAALGALARATLHIDAPREGSRRGASPHLSSKEIKREKEKRMRGRKEKKATQERLSSMLLGLEVRY